LLVALVTCKENTLQQNLVTFWLPLENNMGEIG